MLKNNCDSVVLALLDAPVDPRTGNRVLYSASWTADRESMIGERNEDWVRRELDWFNGASDSLEDMEPPVPKLFEACAGEQGTVNSAYGHILFNRNVLETDGPDSLFDRVLQTLVDEGKHTRHAVAIITDRDIHRIAVEDGKNDFICTNALNFMVDHNDQLHIIVQMRSMDAVFGYRADYSMWDDLMERTIRELQECGVVVTRGDITFHVANLHVYPRHFDLLQKWADKVEDDMNRLARRTWMDRTMRARVEANDAR